MNWSSACQRVREASLRLARGFSKSPVPILVNVDASTAENALIVINGTVISPGGSNMREGALMPVSVGGDGVENWDNFDFVGISEAGDYFVTGDTDGDTAKDEFVFMNDAVVLREGDQVGGLTISGSIEGGYMNEDGDWAVIWDVDQGGSNLEALIVNGELLLLENDLVDWNGDGVIDSSDEGFAITNFSGISSLTSFVFETPPGLRSRQ